MCYYLGTDGAAYWAVEEVEAEAEAEAEAVQRTQRRAYTGGVTPHGELYSLEMKIHDVENIKEPDFLGILG